MSEDRRRRQRRQQRRAERGRQRRSRGPSYEPAGQVTFPGVFGWLQRQQRTFYGVGILVMIASLGAFFFSQQLGTHDADSDDTVAESPTETAEPAETAEPTSTADATEEPSATPDDSDDEIVRNYSEPPPMTIDVEQAFTAVIRTEKGDVRVQLLPEESPEYVNNFVFLARNRFYDGLTFHRVIPGFVAQAGDPTATGFSGAGYSLEEELNDLQFSSGVISMAKSGDIVDGSQFFITLAPQPQLKEAGFTAFGVVTEGLEVLQALTTRDPQQPGQPPGDRILSIEIIEGTG